MSSFTMQNLGTPLIGEKVLPFYIINNNFINTLDTFYVLS